LPSVSNAITELFTIYGACSVKTEDQCSILQKINIANGPDKATRLIMGCMRMPALSKEEASYHKEGKDAEF
jgi:hypothetical protein